MTNAPLWQPGGGPLADIDAAYDNVLAIGDAPRWAARWQEQAETFRAGMAASGRAQLDIAYADGPRHRYDLFLPEGRTARGTAVFVHGGYWRAFDKSVWSHLAAGLVAAGFRVALPSYTLCPGARIAGITREIARFVDHLAGTCEGPIRLCGHSAGGHLVTRMLCADAPIAPATAARITRVLSISGVHDLRPLVNTHMNAALRLDAGEAVTESPALLAPRPGARLMCCAGGGELPEFRRQNLLLANIWHGLGAWTEAVEIAGRHHFDVIEALLDPAGAPFNWLAANDQPSITGNQT